MAKKTDRLAGAFETEKDGFLSGLLAEEGELDRGSLWRIGSWGVGAVVAVVAAVWANQASLAFRHDQLAAADLVRQAQQMQSLAKESQNEARRLSAAVDTLNGDRDRLFARVTVLEQGLDSVTGAIARQNTSPPVAPAAAKPPADTPIQPQAAAPAVVPVATAPTGQAEKPREVASAEQSPSPATAAVQPAASTRSQTSQPATAASLVAAKSILAPPDPAAAKLFEAPKTTEAKATEAKATEAKAAVKADAKPETKPQTKAEAKAETKPEVAPAPQMAAAAAPKESTAQAGAPKEAPAKEIASNETASKETASKDAAAPEQDNAEAALPKVPVPRTEFAVDLGTANSIAGLRALWRGLARSNTELATLRPIIVVRESKTGLGMQLRLAAGPLTDAAAAAKICAALTESDRNCETTVFDGQRLAMKDDDAAPAVVKPSQAAPHKRGYYSRRTKREEPAAAPQAPKEPSSLSRLFGRQ